MGPNRGTLGRLSACCNARARLLVVLLAGFCSFAVSESFAQTARVEVGRLRVELQKVVDVTGSSLSLPLYMATANDNSGRMFFAEKDGSLRMLQNGTFSTFLELSAETYSVSESGLLGFAFHPGYADPLSVGHRKLYTYHSVPVNPSAPVDFTSNVGAIDHHNVVTEWQVDANNPNQVDISTRREIFREAHVSDIHNAGAITFGPDGYLYGTIGAAPLGTTQQLSAQNNANMLGKMYRIDPIDPALTPGSANPVSLNGKYRIPADNPFVSNPSALDEIYAYGLRNPYRFSIDPETGLVFAGDVGQGSREEVDVVPLGGNMGWPYKEGTGNGTVSPPTPAPTMVPPIAGYTHQDGRAIVGGHVYRGSIEELQGKYIFGEFSWGSGAFYTTNGRLLFIDPFDESGNLKDTSTNLLSVEELSRGESCSGTLTAGLCTLDMTLLALATDDDGELYALGARGVNRSIVYKFVDAFYLPEGDYDENGIVDAADEALWQSKFGTTSRIGYGTDGNADGVIDAADYVLWRKMGGAAGAGGGLSNVPEPATVASALLAIFMTAGLAVRHRRPRLA